MGSATADAASNRVRRESAKGRTVWLFYHRQTDCVKVPAMKTLELELPDEVASKIEDAARQRGVSVEELVQTSIEEKLLRDSRFDAAASFVLEKNAELYRRLA